MLKLINTKSHKNQVNNIKNLKEGKYEFSSFMSLLKFISCDNITMYPDYFNYELRLHDLTYRYKDNDILSTLFAFLTENEEAADSSACIKIDKIQSIYPLILMDCHILITVNTYDKTVFDKPEVKKINFTVVKDNEDNMVQINDSIIHLDFMLVKTPTLAVSVNYGNISVESLDLDFQDIALDITNHTHFSKSGTELMCVCGSKYRDRMVFDISHNHQVKIIISNPYLASHIRLLRETENRDRYYEVLFDEFTVVICGNPMTYRINNNTFRVVSVTSSDNKEILQALKSNNYIDTSIRDELITLSDEKEYKAYLSTCLL